MCATVVACGGGGGSGTTSVTGTPPPTTPPPPPTPPPPADDSVTNRLTGSVGDGPIVGALVTIRDDVGRLVRTMESNDAAAYDGTVRVAGDRYPLRIESTGGTDLVTGAPPDFVLSAVIMRPATRSVGNVNPHTTLVVETATQLSDGPTANALSSARTTVLERLNFGLDHRLVGDPLTSEIDDANITVMVAASERLGEMVRRTRDALISAGVADADAVVAALAADLVDGVVDGRGDVGADPRIAAVSHLTSAQVLVESLTNDLEVNGVPARRAMEDAIRRVRPDADADLGSVSNTAEMLTQTLAALEATAAFTDDPVIETALDAVRALPADTLPADVAGRIPAAAGTALKDAIDQAALATPAELERINEAARNGAAQQPSPPRFSFEAASASVVEGATLSVTVRRDASASAASVEWYTVAGSARPGDDYTGEDGAVIGFAAGEATRNISVATNIDGLDEGDEEFRIELRSPSGAELGTPAAVDVTLVDTSDGAPPAPEPPPPPPSPEPPPGDAGRFSLSAASVDVAEGETARLTIRRSAADVAATVDWQTVDGSATGEADFVRVAGTTVSFAAGESEKSVAVSTIDDGVTESDEAFTVRLFAPTGGATLGTPASASVRLLDTGGDAPPPVDEFYAPELLSVDVDGDRYLLTWSHPQHPPEGGYDIIIDGTDTNTAWRTMAQSANVGPLDPTLQHCFIVEARYPSSGEFRRSNGICVDGTSSERVTDGLQVLYNFSEGGGTSVTDVSPTGVPVNLTIADPENVVWGDGVLTLTTRTRIASTGSTAGLNGALSAANAITIEAWVIPANVTQFGPARMVSLSADAVRRNVTLGQGKSGDSSGALYDVRLRTTTTGSNGAKPSLSTSDGSLSTSRTHVVYTRDEAGNATMYLNGVAAASDTIGGDLSNWDADYGLVLGNEQRDDRPWLGTFDLVALYSRALTAEEVRQNFAVDADDTINQPPIAGEDAAATAAGGSVSIDVLANDSDLDGSIVRSSLAITEPPQAGSADVDEATGRIVYIHGGGAEASDSFRYRVYDDAGTPSNEALVTITIAGGNRAPTARDDSATVLQGQSVVIDVLANDLDPEGELDSSSVAIVNGPTHGTMTVNDATGLVTYAHDGGSSTSDSFSYRVSDASGLESGTATVSVAVTPHNPGTGVATVSWTAPTERVDGSSLNGELAGYEVHYGQNQGELGQVVVLDNPGLTSYVVEGLGDGTWYFALKSFDDGGRRSSLSDIGSKTFQ